MEAVNKATTEKVDKKPVERSAENPAISIEKGISFVDSIAKNFSPTQWVTREDIEAVLKTKGLHRPIAATVQYGIISRNKNLYQISPTYKELINPISENEVKKIKIQFFSSPKLYAELIEKYDGHVVPSDLKVHLIRFHNIAPNASNDVAELFFQNARFAGVISDNNILNVSVVSDPSVITPPQVAAKSTDIPVNVENSEAGVLRLKQLEDEKNRTKLLSEVNNPITYKIPLSEKKNAVLTYPHELNEKDIQILKKYIELLELGLN
ncbi:MAG TPA: hypothetical protein VGC01_13195 [Mucilaginibacter sp.]